MWKQCTCAEAASAASGARARCIGGRVHVYVYVCIGLSSQTRHLQQGRCALGRDNKSGAKDGGGIRLVGCWLGDRLAREAAQGAMCWGGED